jgi:glycosyltransferase 2 family protein
MNRRARWLTRLLGPAVLAYFLLTTDLHRIGAHLRDLRWIPLVLSLALFPVLAVTKAWRWTMLIRELGMVVPSVGRATLLFMIGQFAGGATPGQSGDFLRAWYLREQGSPLSSALFSILLDRMFDFLVLALVALLGLVAFLDLFPPTLRPTLGAATLGFAAAMALAVPALMARRPRGWILARARSLAPRGARERMARWQDQLETLDARGALVSMLLLATVAATGVVMVRWWLLFRALDVDVPVLVLVSSSALISILQTLPISVSGIGVRDVVLVAVLARYGYASERALALSALFLVLVVEQMFIGFLVSMRHPLGAAARAASRTSASSPPEGRP